MRLYGYFRSSAAYRVRIGLALKNLAPEQVPIHLVRGGGEQHGEVYRAKNPQRLVPALELDDGRILTQSLAILEYLEETHPTPALLPSSPAERARVRSLALAVACDIHPLNNLRVLEHLSGTIGVSRVQRDAWYRHWAAVGLEALETMLSSSPATGRFSHGETPTLADVCLVPQLYNARRFECPLEAYPTLVRIEAACLELAAFRDARPESQADAE